MARKTNVDLDSEILETEPAPMAPRATSTTQPDSTDTATPDTASSGHVLGDFGDQVVNTGGVYQQVNHNDFIVGSADADYIDAGLGDDLVFGADGDDLIWGGLGHDTIAGGNGHDFIDGGEGVDWLIGDAGNDKLFGGDGDDRLQGGEGNDQLMGMAGADVMTGGAGHDVFIVGHAYYYAPGSYVPAMDVITDFEISTHGAVDRINISQALLTTDFFQRFGWEATAQDAFAHGYVALAQHGMQGAPGFGTKIYVDTNGAAAGGELICMADVVGIAVGQLNTPYHSAFFI
jgi:Ca2+-binding RTX toxin-like protein